MGSPNNIAVAGALAPSFLREASELCLTEELGVGDPWCPFSLRAIFILERTPPCFVPIATFSLF